MDEYSEKWYRISASLPSATRSLARVKSYGDVLEEYEYHAEAKCADASGEPCDRQSVGLLGRRHVRIEKLHFIGKESNKLEEVEEQGVTDAGDVYTEYPNPRRDEWETKWPAAGLHSRIEASRPRRLKGDNLCRARWPIALSKHEGKNHCGFA
jgi:hypothetical protein